LPVVRERTDRVSGSDRVPRGRGGSDPGADGVPLPASAALAGDGAHWRAHAGGGFGPLHDGVPGRGRVDRGGGGGGNGGSRVVRLRSAPEGAAAGGGAERDRTAGGRMS